MPRSLRKASAAVASRSGSWGNPTKTKLPALGVTSRPSSISFSRVQANQVSLCLRDMSVNSTSPNAASPAAMAGELTLKGPLSRFNTPAMSVGQ